MGLVFLSFDEFDLIKGHIPFDEMESALLERYGDPQGAGNRLAHCFAKITEEKIEVIILNPETGEPTDATDVTTKTTAIIKLEPYDADFEPVTVCYFKRK